MDPTLAKKRFDVSSDEALSAVFSDAVALFFRDDCIIAASRAPAYLLIPGACITDYVPELSSDRFFDLPFPEVEELNIGILSLQRDDVSVPLSRLMPSLGELTKIFARASVIRESVTGSDLYSRIAEVVCAIAKFTGVGASSAGFSGDNVLTDSFNAPAFLALTLGTAMLFRRTALRRSFSWAVDVVPGRNTLGKGEKTGNIPLLRFDAVLSEEVSNDDIPEIGALGRIAEMWGAQLECYLTPTKNGGKRLCVCFSPVCRDVGEQGLKADTKCSDDGQEPYVKKG